MLAPDGGDKQNNKLRKEPNGRRFPKRTIESAVKLQFFNYDVMSYDQIGDKQRTLASHVAACVAKQNNDRRLITPIAGRTKDRLSTPKSKAANW